MLLEEEEEEGEGEGEGEDCLQLCCSLNCCCLFSVEQKGKG